MSVLTTRELMDAVRAVTPHVDEMVKAYEQASLEYLQAKVAFDRKEADAYLEAKQTGATEGMAKRIASIKASDERFEMDRAAAAKAAARLGSDSWGQVLEFYSALSHTLNRELKTFADSGAGR